MQNDTTTEATVSTVEQSAPIADAPTVDTTTEAAAPAKPKRERKPKQAKAAPVKPVAAKPAKPAGDAQRSERVAIVAECLALAAQHYGGASPSFHRSARPCKRADYIARVLSPVQTAKSPSERDESHLATIVTKAKRGGEFDPAALACDLGVISRLASLSLISYSEADDTFALTTTGAKLARNVAKRLIVAGA